MAILMLPLLPIMQLIKRKQIKRLNLLLRQALKTASPSMVRKPFVQKQAQTVDQSRSAQNAAAAIEQMVNTGAVSRGQFGQVVAPAVAEVTSAPSNNAYISQSPVKQEARENVEKTIKYNSSVQTTKT